MHIRYRTWRRIGRIVGVIVLAPWLYFFFTGNDRMAELIFFGLALPIGLSGVYLAFTTRIGWVEMTFTDEDRTTLGYRIGREVAIREFGFWGNRFSRKYFDSYQVGRLNQAVDDKQQPKANPE